MNLLTLGGDSHEALLCMQSEHIESGSQVMEMLMSLQEGRPAAEGGRPDASSLRLVSLHQRRFSTG